MAEELAGAAEDASDGASLLSLEADATADDDAAVIGAGTTGPAARVMRKMPTITTAAAARILQPTSRVVALRFRVTAFSPACCVRPPRSSRLLEEHWAFVETKAG